MKIVINDPGLGHEHFAGAFGGEKLVGAGHDSPGRLQAEPNGESQDDKTSYRNSLGSLSIKISWVCFDKEHRNNVNRHDKIDIHSPENNFCNCHGRTLMS